MITSEIKHFVGKILVMQTLHNTFIFFIRHERHQEIDVLCPIHCKIMNGIMTINDVAVVVIEKVFVHG
jgi:hypothetical protein